MSWSALLSFLTIHGTTFATIISDTSRTNTVNYQHYFDAKGYQLATSKLIKSELKQPTMPICPNGLQDGSYIFRSSSEENWSFCGVRGPGFHQFFFQISGCECFAGNIVDVCVSAAAPNFAEPTRKISASPLVVPPLSPTIHSQIFDLHCSQDDYDISPTDTCLLITLTDQFGDGWTSGDGSSENVWFGYSHSSSNDDVASAAITYHSLSCSCPRKIGCISPSSIAKDQVINLAIYSKDEEKPAAFFWEIMYLVQVIQNGQLTDSYHGSYYTQMEFSYTHSSDTFTLSSKTDGPISNGDAVDISKCDKPGVDLVSELSQKGWSIVDIDNKHETYLTRNPFCFLTQFLSFSQSKLFLDQKSFAKIPNSSRQLNQELESADVSTLSGVTTFGSINGIGTNSQYKGPIGVSISSNGLYALIADNGNHLIRKIILSTSDVITLAGSSSGSTNGIGTISKFKNPTGISISPDDSYALIGDYNNDLIRKIILTTATVTTLAGDILTTAGSTNGIGTYSKFNNPQYLSISSNGIYAVVGDWGNHLIRKIVITTANVSTLAGVALSRGATNGIGTNSLFDYPRGISISPDNSYALVADSFNHLIRKIILSTASVSTLAGVTLTSGITNGIGTNSLFYSPAGLTISSNGIYALVGDFDNHLIRKIILSTASVSTLAGEAATSGSTNGIGTNSRFYNPRGVAISPDGVYALVGDSSNNLIRQIRLMTSPSSAPTSLPSLAPTSLPSSAPTSLPSLAPTSLPSTAPTSLPSLAPTSLPSLAPTSLPLPIFSFGVKIGNKDILSSGNAILIDYLQDKRRGKMIPISGIVNATEVSSAFDPPLSSDSILIKWRPVSAVSGIGSWEPNSHTILRIPIGGVLVSWLVSLLSEEIKGFIIKDPMSSSYLIHFIENVNSSSSSSSSSQELSVSDPGISVSISPNKTLTAWTLREYIPGVSDKRLYLLNSGLVR